MPDALQGFDVEYTSAIVASAESPSTAAIRIDGIESQTFQYRLEGCYLLWLCSMEFVDRALAVTVTIFLLGILIGDSIVVLFPASQEPLRTIIQFRMLSPIQTAAEMGSIALFFLVFLNNSIPAVLSFLYPLAVARITWTPPLTENRRKTFMVTYTYLSALLTGFFAFGVPLGLTWIHEGTKEAISLLSTARVHGPLELFFVLACISEPLRLTQAVREETVGKLRDHLLLLWISLAGLSLSAGIEVFMRL
jgi:hypothetical protein